MKTAQVAIYVGVSLLLSIHYFRTPMSPVDMLDFAGCVFSIHDLDPVSLHKRAYEGILKDAPSFSIPHLLGTDGDPNVGPSRRDRHANPNHFVESLPYFSIKPLYIELIAIFYRLGIRIFPAIILASVIPAFCATLLMCAWTLRLGGSALLLCIFLFVPEIRGPGSGVGPDALSVLALAAALFLIFMYEKFCPGITLLLASIWIRTDNAIVALFVLGYLLWKRRLPLWMTSVLAAVAVASPLLINHFGGSYGWRALYSHTFKFVEFAPGEFTASFTTNDHLHALRAGLAEILQGSVLVYFVLGAVGYFIVPELRVLLLLVLTAGAVHFVIYPNFEPRYYAIVYFLIAVAATVAISRIIAARNQRIATFFQCRASGF
jgi:hypothetical protein